MEGFRTQVNANRWSVYLHDCSRCINVSDLDIEVLRCLLIDAFILQDTLSVTPLDTLGASLTH